MRSLLNMAAFRSRTDALLACQLGSAVSVPLAAVTRASPIAAWLANEDEDAEVCLTGWALALALGSWKWSKLSAFGEARGDDEGEQGWVICILSRCCCCWWLGPVLKLLLCGGDTGPLLRVSSAKGEEWVILLRESINVTHGEAINSFGRHFVRRNRKLSICLDHS